MHLDFIDPGNAGGSIRIPELPPFHPDPIVYLCSVCGRGFLDQDDLFDHRFENHPFRRPALILRGKEITSPREIVASPLSTEDIVFANTNIFKINGKHYEEKEFIIKLSKQTQGVFELSLANHGVETSYELEFDIPDREEIAEVERLFFSLLGKEEVNLPRINAFIDAAEYYQSARRYIDGLSHYLYGLLAKDQKGGTHLAQHEYKAKFNISLDTLKIFDTPLALVISGIIDFNQNVFTCTELLSSAPKLKQVTNRFACITRGEHFEFSYMRPVSNSLPVPLDSFTDRLIKWATMDWSELSSHRKEIEFAINSPEWVADDRFKAQILLTEMFVSTGDFSAARIMARKIVNDAIFGDWAQRIMDRSN